MGHHRLGRLPRTLRWRQVVELLDRSPEETGAVAAAAIEAADGRLRQLANDATVTYCVWLLTRITWAARGDSFAVDLGSLGVHASEHDSALTLISRIGDRVRDELASLPVSGQFADIASLALRRALTETIGEQGRTLFGSSTDDVQRAFQEFSTRARFSVLTQRFFADFMARTLRAFVDRELSNHLGSRGAGSAAEQGADFLDALDRHTRQAARIVEEFAGGWYSKHNWESKGEVTRDEAHRFTARALQKLRSELKRGAEPL